MRALDSRWECTIVGGQTRVRVWTLINYHRNFEHVQSWWERSTVDESAWELAVKREREFELSSTIIEILNTFKVDESARQSMRVHDSWRSNKSESLNSHQLSSKFWTCSKLMRALDSRWECMRVGGQTRERVWTLINYHRNFEHVQSWWERSTVDESAR